MKLTSLSSSVGYSSFKILWCSHSFAICRNIETRCNEYFGGIDGKWTLGGLNRSSILLLFPGRLSKSTFNFYSRIWFSFADHMVSELAIRSNSGAYRNNWNRGIQQLKIWKLAQEWKNFFSAEWKICFSNPIEVYSPTSPAFAQSTYFVFGAPIKRAGHRSHQTQYFLPQKRLNVLSLWGFAKDLDFENRISKTKLRFIPLCND